VKTIEKIRLENLSNIRSNFRFISDFSKILRKSEQVVSQWLRNPSVRSIGSTSAREIEEIMGLPQGWLDNDHEPRGRLSEALVKSVMAEMLPETPQTAPTTFAEKLRDAVFTPYGHYVAPPELDAYRQSSEEVRAVIMAASRAAAAAAEAVVSRKPS